MLKLFHCSVNMCWKRRRCLAANQMAGGLPHISANRDWPFLSIYAEDLDIASPSGRNEHRPTEIQDALVQEVGSGVVEGLKPVTPPQPPRRRTPTASP